MSGRFAPLYLIKIIFTSSLNIGDYEWAIRVGDYKVGDFEVWGF
jgi:hypothetical protein